MPVMGTSPRVGSATPSFSSSGGFVAGIVDLVYRDPETGLLVIADYKTDAVASREEAERYSQRYASQGGVYVRAVEEMPGLEKAPRFELWYLSTGHVEICSP